MKRKDVSNNLKDIRYSIKMTLQKAQADKTAADLTLQKIAVLFVYILSRPQGSHSQMER